jgi:hypothetical protein
MNSKLRRKSILEDAWLGDAVLALFARQRILSSGQGIDNEKAIRMTSNKFLTILGASAPSTKRKGSMPPSHTSRPASSPYFLRPS